MNSVILIGRLTRDPELRYISSSGMAVCQFTLAVDKNLTREKREQFIAQGRPTADFIRIVVWGKQAENCNTYLEKGRRVAIQGSISVSSYKTPSGETRYSTDVSASTVEFLDRGERKTPVTDNRDSFNSSSSMESYDDFNDDFESIGDNDDIPF